MTDAVSSLTLLDPCPIPEQSEIFSIARLVHRLEITRTPPTPIRCGIGPPPLEICQTARDVVVNPRLLVITVLVEPTIQLVSPDSKTAKPFPIDCVVSMRHSHHTYVSSNNLRVIVHPTHPHHTLGEIVDHPWIFAPQ